MMNKELECNVFYQVAQAMWKAGADGEEVARSLAKAFDAIITEGISDSTIVEYIRFIKE